ncbi:MAG: competence/damage-inducible protein A [bacterium]|nr:competence/damage-inducible protein A [bacterium]
MIVEVISIGDELLIGQTVNTNAAWMGTAMREIGADMDFGTVIRDEENDLRDAFERALTRADVVLVTGGLGPTKDDITKHVLCDYFNTQLVENSDVLEHVRGFFEARGRKMLDVNIMQAHVPEKATVLHNEFGTAPGMWFEENGKILVSMPGVPYEMKYIMREHVIPRLQARFDLDKLYYQTLQTQGIGESYIADRIESIENEVREAGFALAYLPSPGSVRLRIASRDTEGNRKAIAGFIDLIAATMPKHAFGKEEDTLEEVVGKLLREREETVTTIESCTGGAVAAKITSISGASDYFNGALITYSNEMKTQLVGVDPAILDDQNIGAVSQQTVEQMAVGGRERMQATYGVALSGVAGPNGGTDEKPVGTVWIAVAGPKGVFSKKCLFESNRERNIRRSVLTALNLLRCEILGLNQ